MTNRHEIAMGILAEEIECVTYARNNKGGQQVPCHRELIGASPSTLSYLQRLIRDAGPAGSYEKISERLLLADALADAVHGYLNNEDRTTTWITLGAALDAYLAVR